MTSALILDENTSDYQIRAYTPGKIQINDMLLTESVIISRGSSSLLGAPSISRR